MMFLVFSKKNLFQTKKVLSLRLEIYLTKLNAMKGLLTKFGVVVLFLVACSFVSCKGKDHVKDGFFVVGGKTYRIDEAKLEPAGYDDGYYQLKFTLRNNSENNLHSMSFVLYSEVNQSLPSGVYTPFLGNMDYKYKFRNGVWYAGNEPTGIHVGTVKVSNNKNYYTITVDSEDAKGMGVAAKYVGELYFEI